MPATRAARFAAADESVPCVGICIKAFLVCQGYADRLVRVHDIKMEVKRPLPPLYVDVNS